MEFYLRYLLCWVMFSEFFTVCDRIESNEAKITILSKELRSLHQRVDDKIISLQEQIVINRGAEEGHRYYQMRKLFRKFGAMKFQLLTLKMDIRQLFYRGNFMKTDMEHFVRNKTEVLDKKIANLQNAMKAIFRITNKTEGFEILKSVENEISDANKVTEKTKPFITGNNEPLQDMEITMVVGERFIMPCEHEDGNTSGKLHWFRNGRRVETSSSKGYSIRYSEKSKSSTFTISRLQQKDFGIIECKDDNFKIVLRVHLYVKAPCKEYICDGSCVEISRVCDNINDCSRGQDENSCDLAAAILQGDIEGNGPVTVFLNKMKGQVCDPGWDNSAAVVLCRSLGFSKGEKGSAETSTQGKSRFVISSIICTGNERNLAQCNMTIARVDSCNTFATVVCT